MHLEAVIERVSRCTGRPWLSELRDAFGVRNRASLEMHLEAEIERVGGRNRASLEIHLEAVIKRVWRCTWRPRSNWTQSCTWRPRSSEFGEAFGGRDCVTQRCTWRPWSSEFGDALGGRDRVNPEMHLEAVIERVWRCTWRPRSSWTQRCTWTPRSSEIGDAFGGRDWVTQWCTWRPWCRDFEDALGGRDRVNSEMHLEAEMKLNSEILLEAVIKRVWRCTCSPWSNKIGGVLGGSRQEVRRVLRLYPSVS